MTCPACKRQIQGFSRFCPYCAEPLRRCRSCEIFYLSDVAFCGSCGKSLIARDKPKTATRQLIPQAAAEPPKVKSGRTLFGYLCAPARESSEMPFFAGETLVGAGGNNDIIISSPAVSWNHAIIICRDGKAIIQDTASTNGTFLNGARITAPQQLNQGDLLRFGSEEFQVWLKSKEP